MIILKSIDVFTDKTGMLLFPKVVSSILQIL